VVVGCVAARALFGLCLVFRHRLGPRRRRIVLPVLGSDDDVADLSVSDGLLRLGGLALPIAPDTSDGTGPEVHDGKLSAGGVRRGCRYRRFFSITSLPGCVRKIARFEASHAESPAGSVRDSWTVRIDHPWCRSLRVFAWLRELLGPDAWIVIEKILAVDEALEPTLPVDGTTGYDVLREVAASSSIPLGRGADPRWSSRPASTTRPCRCVGGPQAPRGDRHPGQ